MLLAQDEFGKLTVFLNETNQGRDNEIENWKNQLSKQHIICGCDWQFFWKKLDRLINIAGIF